MDRIHELNQALKEISRNPDLPRDEWRKAIDAKVQELTKRYREEHTHGSTEP